jgi:homoserine dehydrogenase
VVNEFNGITIESSFADKQFFKGRGAGAFPTASAVLSDISALRYHYRYEYRKIQQQSGTKLSNDFFLKIFVSADEVAKIEKQDFEWIEEWHNEFQYGWLVGIIHVKKLMDNNWWKQAGISLIAYADAVVADIDYRKISKRSLELAGVF